MGSFSTSASSTSRINKTHHSTSPGGTTRGSPLAQTTPESLANGFCSTPAPTGLSCRGRRTPPLVRPDDRIASCMGASLPAPKHLQGSRILCENLRPGGRNPTGFMGRSPSSDYPDSSPGSLSRQSNVSIPHSHPLHSERPEPKSTSLRAR